MTPLSQSPKPAGANSKVCVICDHPILRVAMCGNEDCPNPEPEHYHCVYAACTAPCKKQGKCKPMMLTDLEELRIVSFKIDSDGQWTPTRDDVRTVGRIRADHKLARQREDETYASYVARLITTLEKEENDD